MNDHYKTLCERRDWLEQRIKAKKNVNWETAYDERERAALVWAIRFLDWGLDFYNEMFSPDTPEQTPLRETLKRIHHPEQARAAKDRDGSSTPKTARRKGRGQRTARFTSRCTRCPNVGPFKSATEYRKHYNTTHRRFVKSPGKAVFNPPIKDKGPTPKTNPWNCGVCGDVVGYTHDDLKRHQSEVHGVKFLTTVAV